MAGLQRPLKIEQRSCLMKCFKILDTAGTPSLTVGATDGTVADGGVGIYTITFTSPFDRAMTAMVVPMEADAIAFVNTLTATAINVRVTTADGATPADATCLVTVIGANASDET